MRNPHPVLLLFAFCLPCPPATAQARPDARPQAAPASCPATAPKLKDFSDEQIRTACQGSVAARPAAEGHPTSYPWLFLCRDSLMMARQAARVVAATAGRRSSFVPELPEELNQQEALDAAARKLLKAHNYTNISLAAIYRSRLKLRKYLGDAADALPAIQGDVDRSRRRAEQEEADERQALGKKNRHLASTSRQRTHSEALERLHREIAAAQKCLELMKQPLDGSFDDWAKVKRDLLKQNFEKFVLRGQADTQGEAVRLLAARRSQREQQYVYDVLTDPAKRDWAYKLAEGCQTNRCDGWASLVSAGGWAARTPVVSIVAKTVSGALAGDLAMRQGLSFWEQLREAANAVTPFGLNLLDTEVQRIERGETRTYKHT